MERSCTLAPCKVGTRGIKVWQEGLHTFHIPCYACGIE